MSRDDLDVALLHVRGDGHGLSRYGDRLAEFLHAGRENGVRVVEADRRALSPLRELPQLVRADVVHVQWSPLYWGDTWSAVVRAAVLAVVGAVRPLVVTMHDVHHEPARVNVDRGVAPPPPSGSSRWARIRRRWKATTSARNLAQALITRGAREVVVFSPEEAAQMTRRHARRVRVVPHFIEQYVEPPARDPAGKHLVVFGWIHPRKGQLLAVEALPLLPGWSLTLCGAAEPRHQDYLGRVLARAEELGVGDRLTVTGFVSDEEMAEVFAQSRLALCPYQRIAASGSISSLVSRGLPVVAHSTAYTRRLAQAAPSGVMLFSPWTAEALAAGVLQSAETDVDAQRDELSGLALADGPAVTRDRHEQVYRDVLAGSARGRRR